MMNAPVQSGLVFCSPSERGGMLLGYRKPFALSPSVTNINTFNLIIRFPIDLCHLLDYRFPSSFREGRAPEGGSVVKRVKECLRHSYGCGWDYIFYFSLLKEAQHDEYRELLPFNINWLPCELKLYTINCDRRVHV
ncbi:hypothetical protein GOODEAATRI_003812 [Goodea atripinnis]|uniref:Uncharacterized protein n=1 Tax=Goodea atripinnis TaxID=208336 RepID=A0ABV0MGU0_9TELE